jgi:DNA recombination protein RmuC
MAIELTVFLALAFGLAIGALFGWLSARPQLARLTVRLEQESALHAERLKAYQDAELALRDSFHAISGEALKVNTENFLNLAAARFGQARAEATADVDARKQAIENLLAPMQKTLEQVDRQIKDAERHRVEGGTRLLEKIAALDVMGENLRDQTRRLTDALKSPVVRGRWGELQLKRVFELAGMIEHCDFDEQHTVTAGGSGGDALRRMRPDAVIRLPGGKHVVVDAKVPLESYLKALEAPDESTRQALMKDHARQVRVHLTQLAAKGYAAHVQPSPDFVVMFLPGEVFFSAALEQDPTLIEFGVEQKVIPASPTTLIALLRAVSYGWQQQAVEENARKISDLGRNLYESVRVLGGHFEALGARLKSSLDAYNLAVGSLEGNVLVKARKFKELQAAAGDEVKPLEPIDRVPRMLQAPELTGGLPFAEQEVEVEAGR